MDLVVSETTDALTLVLLPLYEGVTMLLGRLPVEPTYALSGGWLEDDWPFEGSELLPRYVGSTIVAGSPPVVPAYVLGIDTGDASTELLASVLAAEVDGDVATTVEFASGLEN